MSRNSMTLRVAAVAVPVFLLVISCSPLKDATGERAVSGWYMELQVDLPTARSISVSEYTVTGLSISVRDPGGDLLQTIAWSASDGSRTYQIPLKHEGQHQIDVTHIGVLNGETVQASESASFDIAAMKITLIDIVPGSVGGIRVKGGQPDLVVSALTVTSWSPAFITYSYTIKNIGTAPANLDGPTANDADNVSVQAFLSADTIFSNAGDIAAGGTIIGSSPLGFLNPGETRSGSFESSAPVNPSATPYLVLKVDWGGVVAESDESNNTLAALIVPSIDLVVSDLSVTAWTPTSISYSYTVRNIGTAPVDLAGPTSSTTDDVSVQAFVSADTIFGNAGDLAAGGTILSHSSHVLNPGDSFSGTFSSGATVNPAVTPYLVLKVDWGDVVTESNETNNTRAALIVHSPDLVVTSLAVTSATSTSISYSFTITNIGSAPVDLAGSTSALTDDVSVQAYISADTIFSNAGDIAAGGTVLSHSSHVLNPGDSFSGTFSAGVTYNTKLTPYLLLMVDFGNAVAESDETNNVGAVKIP